MKTAMKKIRINPFSTANRSKRQIEMTPEIVEVLEARDHAFQKKFGRQPGPGDPIFFDPDADQPRFRTEAKINKVLDRMCDVMLNAGIDPAKVYATRKTGLLPTTDNLKNLPPGGLEEWQDAITEYWSTRRSAQ
jgi:hypothetical protein